MQMQAPQRAGGERAMSRKRGDAVGSRCHRREGRDGVLMLFVSTCRASEFCVRSHVHLVSHDRYSQTKPKGSSRENPDAGRPRRVESGETWMHTVDTDAHTSVVTIVETVETHEDSRASGCSESRFARRARTVAPVGRLTPLTFGGSRPGKRNHAQSYADCSGSVTLIGTAVARPVA